MMLFFYRLLWEEKEVMHNQKMSTQIVAEVLKEHNTSSTFLSTMGNNQDMGGLRTSASAERVQELDGKSEQQNREGTEANVM
jgi:hypothetical protein